MSVQLVSEQELYGCCVCPVVGPAPWSELQKTGWESHYAGLGVEPILLCGSCKDLMADRREAHRLAIEQERREVS